MTTLTSLAATVEKRAAQSTDGEDIWAVERRAPQTTDGEDIWAVEKSAP